MKLKLLASTIEAGSLTNKQHYTCFLIDDIVALDAGNLASATGREQKSKIRNIVLTHAHLDHIAGLPLFLDDLFELISDPITIFAVKEVIEVLENDIFNWRVYPRFSELENEHGPIMKYSIIERGIPFFVEHLEMVAVSVNHKVPSVGYWVSDGNARIVVTGDTAEMGSFWSYINSLEGLDALLIECAFPNRLKRLAEVSHHLTPEKLGIELDNFAGNNCPIFVINLKPMYQEETAQEVLALGVPNLKLLDVGSEYEF